MKKQPETVCVCYTLQEQRPCEGKKKKKEILRLIADR